MIDSHSSQKSDIEKKNHRNWLVHGCMEIKTQYIFIARCWIIAAANKVFLFKNCPLFTPNAASSVADTVLVNEF